MQPVMLTRNAVEMARPRGHEVGRSKQCNGRQVKAM